MKSRGRDQSEAVFGKYERLSVFIRFLVSLDQESAKKAFSKFLDIPDSAPRQICFVDMIIVHLKQGVMDAELLYKPPFTNSIMKDLTAYSPALRLMEL